MSQNFVGRKFHLEQFEDHHYHIMSGQPRIVLLEGEAGIGKSRFLQEIQGFSESSGIRVCSGYGADTFTRPYAPFSGLFPVLQSEGVFSDPEPIGVGVCSDTPTTAFNQLTFQSLPSDQIRLMIDVTSASITLARQMPLMLIVDDLHLADDSSLELFDYIACELIEQRDLPILLLGSYRPQVAKSSLSSLLDRLLKHPITRQMTLSNFDEFESRELIESWAHQSVTQYLVESVLDITRGIPFYIEQLMLHFSYQDALVDQGGYLGLSDVRLANSVTLQTPEGIIGPRLDALADATHDILTVAALISGPCSAETLVSVTGATLPAIQQALKVALEQGLLTEQSGSIEFAHDLVRQLLKSRMSIEQLQQAHFTIACGLENSSAEDSNSHILSIAYHVVQAGSLVDAEHTEAATQQAGDLAMKIYAWGQAVFYYEAALLAMESRPRYTPSDLARYYYQAGVAHYRNQDVGPSWERFEQSVKVHTQSGDKFGLACALMWLTRLGFAEAATSFGVLPPHAQRLRDLMGELDDSEPILRGYLMETLSQAYRHGRLVDDANQIALKALSLGQEYHDLALTAKASTALAMSYAGRLEIEPSIKHHLIALDSAFDLGDIFLEAHSRCNFPLVLCLKGDFESAQSKAKEGAELSRVLQDWVESSKCLSHLAVVSAARGDFEMVEKLARESLAQAKRSGYPWGAYRAVQTWASTFALKGLEQEAEKAPEVLSLIDEPGAIFRTPGEYESLLARVLKQLALLYHHGMPTEPLAPLCHAFCQVARNDTYSLAPLCATIELAELSRNPSMVEAPVKILSGAMENGVLYTSGWVFSVPRVLGVAAVLVEDWEVAAAHFARAFQVTMETEAWPEYARTCLDYARMLFLIGDKDNYPRAIDSAGHGVQLLSRLGIQLHARRGTKLKELLALDML